MKKFKNVFIVMLAILTYFSLTTVTLKADSGWDSSYDSSSSWDSGSSWSSSDSSWSSSSYSGGSGSVGSALIMFIIIIVVIFVISKNSNNSNAAIPPNLAITRPSVSDEILNKYGLNKSELLDESYELYKNVQIAWMNFDFDNLRKYLSDELFNTYKMQLNALKVKKQKNIMEDFTRRQMAITEVGENDGLITVTVELLVAQKDYVVDENNKVVKGINSRKMLVHYELTFTLTKEKNKGKCPNCNAPIDNQASSVCMYCGSTIVTKNHGLIMTKKQNKGQGWV